MNDNKNKTKLGKILLKQKLVNSSDLEMLLDDQKNGTKRLASQALEKGLVKDTNLLKALSEQHGVPATNLEELEIPLSILNIIPQDIAKKHLVLPVSTTADTINLAMANPDDRRVVDEIEFVSGKRVFPHVALHTQIVKVIEDCYNAQSSGDKMYRGRMVGVQRSAAKGSGEGIGDPGAPGTVIADYSRASDVDLSIEVDIPIDDVTTQKSRLSEPASEPIPIPVNETEESLGKPGAIKILVVDDEDDIRLLISRVLDEKGYNVVTAARGLEAIQKVQTTSPDMIILDAMLPEVHGFDICKKIKGSSKYGHIPVIMISAIYRGWRYAQDLKDSYGVDDFIEKPFKINELIKKVEQHSRESNAQVDSRTEDLSKEAEHTLAAGISAYRAGKIEEAIDLLKKGISIDPLAYKLHYHLALLLGKKGLSYQAIRSLESTLELAPEYFPALKNLAVLYQKAGFKFKAVETWERALGSCSEEETRDGIKRHLMTLL